MSSWIIFKWVIFCLLRFGCQPWRARGLKFQALLLAVQGSSKWSWPSLIKQWVSWLILPFSSTETGANHFYIVVRTVYHLRNKICDLLFSSLSFFSFGIAPAGPLQVLTPLSPNQSIEVTLPLSTVGPVMKMEPLNNLQVTPSQYSSLKFYLTKLVFYCKIILFFICF